MSDELLAPSSSPLTRLRREDAAFVTAVVLSFFTLLSLERALAGWGLGGGTGFPETVRPLEMRRMTLIPAAGLGVGPVRGAFGATRLGGGDGASGSCIVIDVDVFIPMTKRLLTSSKVEGLMFPATTDAAESAELRLLGSPFIRFRINCVAAVNWGIYGGRVAGGESVAGVVVVVVVKAGVAAGAGLGVGAEELVPVAPSSRDLPSGWLSALSVSIVKEFVEDVPENLSQPITDVSSWPIDQNRCILRASPK